MPNTNILQLHRSLDRDPPSPKTNMAAIKTGNEYISLKEAHKDSLRKAMHSMSQVHCNHVQCCQSWCSGGGTFQ